MTKPLTQQLGIWPDVTQQWKRVCGHIRKDVQHTICQGTVYALSDRWMLNGLLVIRGTVPLHEAIVRLFDD